MIQRIDAWKLVKWHLKPPYPEGFFNCIKFAIRLFLKDDSVLIESSSKCQLTCPICSTGSGKNKKGPIGWGHLKFENLRRFIDSNPRIRHFELSAWGEALLNPDFQKILKYSYRNKVNLSCRGGVNLNTASDGLLKDIVRYRLRYMTVSIDGATNETYQKYRKGGNLDTVISNVRKINYWKKRYKSRFPRLCWQFILFRHNEHEVIKAKKIAQKIGMDFRIKLNHTSSFSPVKNRKRAGKINGLGVSSREEFEKKYKKGYINPCLQLWSAPQINWDGKLLGCCENVYADFGNVFESGFRNCINSKKYRYAKRMVLGKARPRKDIPCYYCKYLKTPFQRQET